MFLFVLLLLSSIQDTLETSSEPKIAAKIILGPNNPNVPTTTPSTTKSPPDPRRPPRPVWGPVALQSLRGRCFRLVIKEYEYSLCPGINITQRQTSQTWNSFWGILGIFDTWTMSSAPDILSMESDLTFTNYAETFQHEQYNDGTDCGGAYGQKRRNATVEYMCSGAGGGYVLKNVTETTTCEYSLLFACPEACYSNWLVAETSPQPTNTPDAPSPTFTSIPSPSSSPSPSLSPSPLPLPSITSMKEKEKGYKERRKDRFNSHSVSDAEPVEKIRDSVTLIEKIDDTKVKIEELSKSLNILLDELQISLTMEREIIKKENEVNDIEKEGLVQEKITISLTPTSTPRGII